MNRKVLLVDNELKIIGHILKDTDWTIQVLITQQKNISYKNNARVKKIYTHSDFLINSDLSNFKYEDFYSFWHAQLKVENCFNRRMVDYQLGKWSYYRGFALVKKIFEEQEIDFVIVKGLNHGWVYDRLITDMASQKGINNYNVGAALWNTRTVYNNLTNKLVPINIVNNIDIEKSLFYELPKNNRINATKGFRGKIYKLSYKFFGTLGINLVKHVENFSLGKAKPEITVWSQIEKYLKLKKAKKYLDSIAVDLNINKNYICYAMHLEPEAAVAGMAEIDSQIAIIQMLASNLPQGWRLYVKEHPHQFLVNKSDELDGFIYSAGVFKTKRFYEEISKIKRVFFLKRETNMKNVIKNCRAMATMTGTIAAEVVSYRKPVMVFAPDRTIYKLSRGFYNISSYDDCKNAIEKIVQQKEVSYDDFNEICTKYLIDFSDEFVGYKKAVKVIEEDIKCLIE